MSKAMILAAGQPLTMSSREIAELVEKRHDNVKRTIDTLAERGVIEFPQIEEIPTATKPTTVYHLEKRDTLVVVAQLSPEFTARVVDRWQQLEAQNTPAMLTGPQLMAAALIEANATMQAQAQQIASMEADVAAHALIAGADGLISVTETAKNLGERPMDLFRWLSCNHWIYKRPGSTSWLAYAEKCDQWLLRNKSTTITRADGTEKIVTRVLVTPKGLTRLAAIFAKKRGEVS